MQTIKAILRFILGFVLFVIGIGLIYVGCWYKETMLAGLFKTLDAWVYIICFGASLFGWNLMFGSFSKRAAADQAAETDPDQPISPENRVGSSDASGQ